MPSRDEARRELARRELAKRRGRLQFNEEADQFEPQSQPGEPFDFNAGQALLNVPGSTLKLAKDSIAPLVHPIDTAVSLGNLAVGLGAKLFPGKQEQEIFADQLGQVLKDRYGSIDNLQRTIQNDPVGVLSDFAGLLAGGGAAVGKVAATGSKVAQAGQTASRIGRQIDPVNIALKGSAVGIANVPGVDRAAEALFTKGAKFASGRGKKTGSKLRQENIENVRTSLREGITPSDKGIGKMERLINEIGDEINNLIDSAAPGTEIRAADIIAEFDRTIENANVPGDPRRGQQMGALQSQRRDFLESVADPAELGRLQDEIAGAAIPADRRAARADLDSFLEDVAENGTLTVRQAQTAKQRIGQRMNFEAPQGSATFIGQEGEQAIRRGERAALEEAVPGIAQANARQAALLQLRDPLNKSASVIGRNNIVNVGVPLNAGAGALLGSPAGAGGTAAGAAAGVALGVLQSRRVQTEVAAKLAALVRAGRTTEAAKLSALLAAQSAKLAGRAGQQEGLQ